MIEALNNPDKFLHDLNLKELAQSTRTKFEQGTDAARSAQSVVDESTAGLIESQDGLSSAIQDLSKTFTDFVIENPSAGYASSCYRNSCLRWAGGLFAVKKAKDWLTGKTINVAAGAAAENAADLTKASRFSNVGKFANKIPRLKSVPVHRYCHQWGNDCWRYRPLVTIEDYGKTLVVLWAALSVVLQERLSPFLAE